MHLQCERTVEKQMVVSFAQRKLFDLLAFAKIEFAFIDMKSIRKVANIFIHGTPPLPPKKELHTKTKTIFLSVIR